MKFKLIKKQDEAKGTKSFFWEPEKPVDWLPGQYFYFTLPKFQYHDPRGTTRHFTISSSPTEGPVLRLTTRIREESGFKKTLDELEIGAEVEGEGPNGTFILDESEKDKNHIFLAGGIGITPFRSMIKYAVDKALPTKIFLIYSNAGSDFTFQKELKAWDKEKKNIKIEFVDTSKTGRINATMIQRLTSDRYPIYWLCGPPLMVDSMENILDNLQVPQRQVRSEKFTGY